MVKKVKLRGERPTDWGPKWSNELAIEILDWLCEHPSVTRCAEKFGLSSKLLWLWARNSARDEENEVTDSKYIVHGWDQDPDKPWPKSQMFFHVCLVASRRIASLNLDADFRQQLSEGRERVVIEGGKIQYEIDPMRVEMGEALDCLPHFPYKLDKNNRPVKLTVRDPLPAATQILGMRATISGTYDVAEKREVRTTVVGGIQAITPQDRPSTPMSRDLEARLAEIKQRGAQNPHPRAIEAPKKVAPPPPPSPPRDANERDHIGVGKVPDGGMKMV